MKIQDPGAYAHNINALLMAEYESALATINSQLERLKGMDLSSVPDEDAD